jgi:shikimate dehydrogenase
MSRRIDGATKLAGLIGWPLDHTLSPAMHNAAYEALGLDWVYVPLAIRDGADLTKVVAAIRALPFVGFNVTMPYKRLMLNVCDEVASQAQLAGAVNTVQVRDGRLIGYNTDGRGFLECLEREADLVPEGRRAVILGAGGAAGAALVALVLARAAHVVVAARRIEQAEFLVERVSGHARGTEILAVETNQDLRDLVETADLVVNATPLGMSEGDESPVDPSWLQPGQVVSDMIYSPTETRLMRDALARGARPVGGLGMLVAQGAMSIEIWGDAEGTQAPRDVMRAAAEAEMAAVAGRGEVERP